MNILVVDDEKEIADIIAAYLEKEKYKVFVANNGKDALDIVKKIRESYTFPVLMLTAKNEFNDRINGLTLGADDYIPKPFNPLEMVARVKAQFRRSTQYNSSIEDGSISVCGLELNQEMGVCRYSGQKLNLTPTEFDILYLLCEKKGKTVSPDDIHDRLWGKKSSQNNNAVMVHVRHLREKIQAATNRDDIIKTVWGTGYTIDD